MGARGARILAHLGVVAGYAALAMLAHTLAPGSPYETFAWPPLGVGLAALLLSGDWMWPTVAISAFVANVVMIPGAALPAVGVATFHTLATFLAARSVRRFAGGLPCEHPEHVLVLLVSGAGCAALDGLAGVASLWAGGLLPATIAPHAWLAWAGSDLLSVLLLTPATTAWKAAPLTTPRPGRREAMIAATSTIALSAIIFLSGYRTAAERALLQTCTLFLPLGWVALRFGARGAGVATLAMAAIAVVGTVLGRGAIMSMGAEAPLLALQVFLGATSVGTLFLGALASDRSRSRAALASSEALLRGVLEGTPDAVCVKDRAQRYVLANHAAAHALGAPAEDVVGKELGDVLPADAAARLREVYPEILQTGRTRAVDLVLPVDGERRLYEAVNAPWRDGAGEVVGVITVARDVTEKRAAEVARARLAAIVDSSADAIFGVSLEGNITTWNASATRLFGYLPEEIIGKPVQPLVPEERLPELMRCIEGTLDGQRWVGLELPGRHRDGRKISLALTLSPTRDPGGEVVGTSVVARELTETAERLRLVLDAVEVGLWFWNLYEDQVTWTPPCRALHGVGPCEEIGVARWLEALHPEDRERTRDAVRRSLTTCADYRAEYRVVLPGGRHRWVSARGRVVCDDLGQPARMAGTVIDVTPQKEAEHAKDTFLAVLSHELRTPMQAVLGWAALLRKQPRDAVTEKGLAAIERNARVQTQIIEDLLDISRIVSGKLHFDRCSVDLADVVGAVVEMAGPMAAARSVRISCAVGCLQGVVFGDPHRLKQVAMNLLTNAIKFTPPGGRVGVTVEGRGAMAVLVVEDNGCGIAPDLLPHIFERFFQAGDVTTRQHGGLGLGLAIVRHMVEAHGGSVSAESHGEGRGAKFTVTLPLVADERRRATRPEHSSHVTLDGIRVLVVDDDADARELLATVLLEAGAEVRVVHSVRAALAEMPNFHPDVLLSDIGMPDEDGYTLIREVRAREKVVGGHVAAVALTAFASPADRAYAISVGYEAHMSKPTNADELAEIVAHLARRRAG